VLQESIGATGVRHGAARQASPASRPKERQVAGSYANSSSCAIPEADDALWQSDNIPPVAYIAATALGHDLFAERPGRSCVQQSRPCRATWPQSGPGPSQRPSIRATGLLMEVRGRSLPRPIPHPFKRTSRRRAWQKRLQPFQGTGPNALSRLSRTFQRKFTHNWTTY